MSARFLCISKRVQQASTASEMTSWCQVALDLAGACRSLKVVGVGDSFDRVLASIVDFQGI